MKNLFGKFRNRVSVLAVACLVMLTSVPAFAVIDVSDATTAITEATTGGTAVMTALIVAFGIFLGYQIVKSLIKRG